MRDSESNEVKKVTPAVECVQKVGSLCIQQKNTGYKEEATSEDVSQTYDSEDVAINDNINLELNPVLSYAMTKGKFKTFGWLLPIYPFFLLTINTNMM